MKENNLAASFEDTLNENLTSCISELAEVGIDSILDEGLFKDIPIISTVITAFQIGKSIQERHCIKKLAVFLNELNKQIADQEKRKTYISKFKEHAQFREKELEYILIILDRYIGFDKPQMLAKIYLSYLDGRIPWDDFARLSETIDRFLPGDYYVLTCSPSEAICANRNDLDAFLRLTALGLMREDKSADTYSRDRNDDASWILQTERLLFRRTTFGNTLYSILELGDIT